MNQFAFMNRQSLLAGLSETVKKSVLNISRRALASVSAEKPAASAVRLML